MRSDHADTLNALAEMQASPAYAVRRSVLAEAERLIVDLETKLHAPQAAAVAQPTDNALLEEALSSIKFDRTRYSQLVLSGSTHTIRTEAANECGRLGVLLDRIEAALAAPAAPVAQPSAEPVAWPINGVRVDGDKVIVAVKGGNDAARWLCGEILSTRAAAPAPAAAGEQPSEAREPGECERCGRAYSLDRPDFEPTRFCHACAHDIADAKAASTRLARAALGMPAEDNPRGDLT